MSGDGNSGDGSSGGWDLNTFNDWATIYNTLGGSGSTTPGTQGSATPSGYQPPTFDVDAYARPFAPWYSQGLSLIRDDFPVEPTLGGGRGGQGGGGGGGRGGGTSRAEEEDEEDEDLGRHPYNNNEMMAVYNAWITVSYDPIVGNQQANKCFWEKVTEVYRQIKPRGFRKRSYTMLRSHFGRVDKQVKKFYSIYSTEAAHYQSGASGADILRVALQVVKDEERWAGGVRSSSG